MHSLLHALTAWDRATFLALNHGTPNRLFDAVMPMLTDLGQGWVQVVAVLALAFWQSSRAGQTAGLSPRSALKTAIWRRRAWVAPLLVSFAISGLAPTIIKNTTDRKRPWWFYQLEHQAGRELNVTVRTVPGVRPERVRGFPSGHTATTVGMATVVTLLYWRRRRRWPLVAGVWTIAGLVGFSRMYLASHWPLDVLGGTGIGVVSGVAAMVICRASARGAAEEGEDGEPAAQAAGTV